MPPLFRLLASTALVVAVPAVGAYAADYDAPLYVEEAPEYVPVEIGNGWYIRGDVGYQFERSFRDSTFGTAPGATSSQDDFPASFSVGMGYRFSDYLRTDATIGYLSGSEADLDYLLAPGDAYSESVNTRIYTAMINGYVDLGTYAGITPYVGGGVGLAWNKREYNQSINFADPLVTDISFRDRKRDYTFAYSLAGGLSYAVTPNLAIDLGYLYTSVPDAEYARITGNGTYAIDKGLDVHEVRLGLRYALW